MLKILPQNHVNCKLGPNGDKILKSFIGLLQKDIK